MTDRVKTTARTRADSNVGPFGGGATKVADVDSLKSLIEMTAREEDFESDRKTREVDPAHYRALLRSDEAAPATASGTEPEPTPTAEASFDDGLDAAFADPDAGREPEADEPTKKQHVDAPSTKQHVDAPSATVRAPALTPVRPVARSSSARIVVLVALLAVLALAAVLALTLT